MEKEKKMPGFVQFSTLMVQNTHEMQESLDLSSVINGNWQIALAGVTSKFIITCHSTWSITYRFGEIIA